MLNGVHSRNLLLETPVSKRTPLFCSQHVGRPLHRPCEVFGRAPVMTQLPLRVYARHDADFSRPLSAPPPAASVPSASTKGCVAEFYDSHKGGNVGYDCWQLGQFVSRRLRYVYEDHEDPRQLFPILHLLSSACLLPTPSPKSVVSSPTDISRTANRSRFNPRAR